MTVFFISVMKHLVQPSHILCFVMAALRSRCRHYIFALWFLLSIFLWPPYGIGQAIIFLPCRFFLLSFFLA